MGYGRLNAKKAVDFLRPPYVLQRLNASGGTDMGAGPLVDVVIMGASGLSDGNYRVKRHEVRKTVFFNATNPKVWGRGVGTTGWESSPNFSMPFCEVVPGTATLNSAVVRTYVYEVYNSNGGPLCQVNCDDPPVFLGWYPASPANVTFAYTVLGTPSPVSVSISSPFCVSGKGVSATLTANPSGGDGVNYSYYWMPSGLTTKSITRPISNCPTTYSVTVTSAGMSGTASKSVYYNGGTCNCGDAFAKTAGRENAIPDRFELAQNYPNPFNPITTIRFALPEAAQTTLHIYNMQGQLVRTLIGGYLSAGYYDVTWDSLDDTGHGVASGIYIYRLDAGDFVQSKKMTLVK